MKLLIPKVGEVWKYGNYVDKITHYGSNFGSNRIFGENLYITNSSELSMALTDFYKYMIGSKWRRIKKS